MMIIIMNEVMQRNLRACDLVLAPVVLEKSSMTPSIVVMSDIEKRRVDHAMRPKT